MFGCMCILQNTLSSDPTLLTHLIAVWYLNYELRAHNFISLKILLVMQMFLLPNVSCFISGYVDYCTILVL